MSAAEGLGEVGTQVEGVRSPVIGVKGTPRVLR
jgi:hypothetical protein